MKYSVEFTKKAFSDLKKIQAKDCKNIISKIENLQNDLIILRDAKKNADTEKISLEDVKKNLDL